MSRPASKAFLKALADARRLPGVVSGASPRPAPKTWRLLFSAEMARAFVEGRKTVTRRTDRRLLAAHPGDLLLGKETWRTTAGLDDLSGVAMAEKCIGAGYQYPWAPVEYAADGLRRDWIRGFDGEGDPKPGRPRRSIYMPDWASRLRARIVSVREEPLQSITGDDVIAEGIDPASHRCGCERCSMTSSLCPATASSLIMAYAELWDSLHGSGSFDANPTIVRVEFSPEATP